MRPEAGKNYTVQARDTLSNLAAQVYGDTNLWDRIWESNQSKIKSGDPNLIQPGEILFIPLLPERQPPPAVTSQRDRDVMALEIGGREILPETGRIVRTVDTVANGFNMTFPWTPGLDPNIDALIRPYAYTPVNVWLGNEKIITGILYATVTENMDGQTVRVKGSTATADLVDSKLKPPYEFSKITLNALITRLIRPSGFTAIFNADTGGAFDRVTANASDSTADFLKRLARQRSVLLTCDSEGRLVVTRANTTGVSVATLEEGVTAGVTGWGATFDGHKRFFEYRAVRRGPSGETEAIISDPAIPRSRFQTVSADDTTLGDIEAAARWARNKTLADTLSVKLTVQDWYDPQGDLWAENTLVTVIAPTMFINDGFEFLVKRVEYTLDSKGRGTVLELVPPTVYTQGEIVEPWSISA